MFNKEKTKAVFGYDIDVTSERKSESERTLAPGIKRSDLKVVDTCPSCGIERYINYKQSIKNKPCPKCHHNSPEMLKIKQNQNKIKSEKTRQKMKDNHWSKKGYESPFKGKQHASKVKTLLKKKGQDQYKDMSEDEFMTHKIKSSLQNGRTIETFNGFTTPENTRIRQSLEGKAWTYDVLSKANFTCDCCKARGGSLHAHHKNAFNAFPEQRFDVANGVCLCSDCHEEFHSKYGRGNNTADQYDLFKSQKST